MLWFAYSVVCSLLSLLLVVVVLLMFPLSHPPALLPMRIICLFPWYLPLRSCVQVWVSIAFEFLCVAFYSCRC